MFTELANVLDGGLGDTVLNKRRFPTVFPTRGQHEGSGAEVRVGVNDRWAGFRQLWE